MNNKEYNPTLTVFYETSSGNYMSLKISPADFDTLQKVKVGGKLFIKKNGFRKPGPNGEPSKSPHAYLEYISPEQVREFEAKQERRKNEESL